MVRGKKELIRIVRTPDGEILVDSTGKKSGRGAYICPNPDCLDKAVKGMRLSKALKTEVPEEVIRAVRERLQAHAASKPGVM